MCYSILVNDQEKTRLLEFYRKNKKRVAVIDDSLVHSSKEEFWLMETNPQYNLTSIRGRLLSSTIDRVRLTLPSDTEVRTCSKIGPHYLVGINRDSYWRFKAQVCTMFNEAVTTLG